MTEGVDWETLADRLGVIERTPEGWKEHSGREAARLALEQVVGEAEMRAAVDHYVAGLPGSELARSVLWLLRPASAIARCREISTVAADLEQRRSAVELLRVVADRRALPWVRSYLDDEDETIQVWGIGILDQLVLSELIEPEEAEDLLRVADAHPNEAVRDRVQTIRELLRNERASAD